MKVEEQYPRLYKTLSKHFGARKAKKLLVNLEDQKMYGLSFYDSAELCGAVAFKETKEGHTYWAKLQYQLDPDWTKGSKYRPFGARL